MRATGTYFTYLYIQFLKYVHGNRFYDDAATASTLRSLVVSAQWGRVRNGRFSVSLYLSILLRQKRRDERERYIWVDHKTQPLDI
jgi:hypothetical protein